MSKKTQRIIVIVLAAALLLTVMLPALSLLAEGKVTQSDAQKTKDSIQNKKNELADLQAQKKETEKRLAAIRNDKTKAKEQMELIESQVLYTESLISASLELLEQYDQQIADKEEEIRDLEVQEREQLEEFYRQVRWMEETGSASYLSILFEASSFAEMLDYATLIADIMDYSDRIIDRLQTTQAELAEARDDLQVSRNEQAEAQRELENQKAELERDRAEQDALLKQIAASESALAKEAKLQADSEAKINKEIKDAEAKYAAQLAEIERQRKEEAAKAAAAQQPNNGVWYWPLPGKYSLTSLFGNRKDPFTGQPANHTGIDIPAPAGTPIYAAADGIVTTVNTNKYASTYGYYCIISHGGGYSTVYAHQKQVPIVKVGQTVKKGQIIGYVGSTGRSTGNHLHFEIRIDNVRYDALRFYPAMTFSYKTYTWKGNNYPSALKQTS